MAWPSIELNSFMTDKNIVIECSIKSVDPTKKEQ